MKVYLYDIKKTFYDNMNNEQWTFHAITWSICLFLALHQFTYVEHKSHTMLHGLFMTLKKMWKANLLWYRTGNWVENASKCTKYQ